MVTNRKMKVLILGANGMLGYKLYQVLSKDFDVYGTVRCSFKEVEEYGIFDREYTIGGIDVRDGYVNVVTKRLKPDVVINCVGIIDKMQVKTDRETTIHVNALFPHQLNEICQQSNIRLIHISTDCVFSGKDGNYVEGSPADATDVYGKTKYLGEVTGDNVLTIRTSLIGRELVRSRGLLEWFISQRGKTVNGFSEAIFSGFPTVTFAGIIKDIILNHPEFNGIYHIASEPISKFTLLNMINDTLHLGIETIKMPAYHCDRSLDATKFNTATGFKPRPWSIMIAELAKDARQYEKWR